MPEESLLQKLTTQLGGCIVATDITQVDRLKVAICGEPKTGKSSIIARTARKPLLVYDFDDRKESIAGQTDVIIKTLVDVEDTKPEAWGKLESDIADLTYLKTKNELPLKSLAFDSMTFLRKYAEHQFMKDSNTTARFKVKVNVTDYIIPKDWDAVTGVQKMLESILSKAFALGVDVYATFHTRPEKDQQRSSGPNVVYKDNLTVDPPNLKMLLPKFNDTWLTYVDGNKYMVQLKPDYLFNAATVLKNVNETEEADIMKLLEKHNKDGK